MAIYTVHAPPGPANQAHAAEHAVFIPEKINWAALLFGPFWILWHRLWLVFLAWLAIAVAVEAVAHWAGPAAGGVVGVLFAVWSGLVANDARRWTLERNGWTLDGIVHGSSREDAEHRWVHRVAALSETIRKPPPPGGSLRPAAAGHAGLPPVVGFGGLPEVRG